MGEWSDNFTTAFWLVSLWLFLFLTVPQQPSILICCFFISLSF